MKRLLIFFAVFALLVAACGGGDSGQEDGAAPDAPPPTQASEAPAPEDTGAAQDTAVSDSDDASEPTGDDTEDEAPEDSASPEPADDPSPGEEAAPTADPIFQPTCQGEGDLSATATGVTADTIKVGAPQIDYAELGSLGLVQIDRGDNEVILQALAQEVNDNGGICGRMVETVTYKFLPFGTDTSLAGCVYFTEDEKVFAVLGSFIRVPTGNICVTETHATALIGAPFTAEDRARANAPWVHLEVATDRALEVFVTALDKAGLLTDLGNVAVHSGANRADLVDRVLVPALEAAGVEIAERTVIDVPAGDTQAGAAVWRTFVEIYRNADINTVFIDGDNVFGVEQLIQGGLDVTLFNAERATFTFGLQDSSDPGFFEAYTLGSPYAGDDNNQRMEDCIDAFERQSGIEVIPTEQLPEDETDWFIPVRGFCRVFDLFVQLAAAAGPNLTNETLQAAIDGFGPIELPNEAFASLRASKYDARDGVVLMQWDPEAGDDNRGDFVVISDLIDTGG
ncbi:MAG: hypothetical protein F4Z02_15345 [Acidimicrobiia bacterium]|nr:hypothetical protein [Acidimicrobiia bacterium]MYG72305.1 hypothetical protein [Acidimicrobiia bacterium]